MKKRTTLKWRCLILSLHLLIITQATRQTFEDMPLMRKVTLGLAIDGIKYRIGGWFK